MTQQGISLDPEVTQAAQLLAQHTYERWKAVRIHYTNSPGSHLVGRLGEFAAFLWFKENNFAPIPHFLDFEQERNCDIDTIVGRIEVKTWKEIHWPDLGRAVAVKQYPTICKKADWILFCSVDDIESATPFVTFRGWIEVDAVGTVEPKHTGSMQIHNYQLEDHHLKDIDLFKEMR